MLILYNFICHTNSAHLGRPRVIQVVLIGGRPITIQIVLYMIQDDTNPVFTPGSTQRHTNSAHWR